MGVPPTGEVPGESGTASPVSVAASQPDTLVIYSINIRCLLNNLTELSHQINRLQPQIVLVQESWLNESIDNVSLPGYNCISRRDRAEQENRGGIICFARQDLGNLVHLKKSDVAERSWDLLHTDTGSILICNWYRPPSSDMAHIDSFYDELQELGDSMIGCIVMGDLNIHHRRWLIHSNNNTAEGDRLKHICDDFDLQQLIREPTRGLYLLDLCLTDLEGSKTEVTSSIADHKSIILRVPLHVPTIKRIPRMVWHLKEAN